MIYSITVYCLDLLLSLILTISANKVSRHSACIISTVCNPPSQYKRFGALFTNMYFSVKAKSTKKIMVGLCLLFFTFVSAQAKELVVITGLDKPPYVISNQNGGYEIELVRQVLATLGYDISLLYVPYGRTYDTMRSEKADIALTLNTKSGVPAELLSQPYVTYQNVAISLKKNNIMLTQLSDFRLFSVIGFQSASKVLGDVFAQAVKKNLFYLELPEQRRQVEMLLLGSVDIVVMDVNIFNYFSRAIKGTNQMDEVTVYAFFPPSQYSAAIKNTKLRENFNAAMASFKLSADYRQLRQKYDIIYPAEFLSSNLSEYQR